MGASRIVQDPRVLVGKPTVRGTRISVELVLERLAYGHPVADILASYPRLTREDVLACLEYARGVIAKEIVPEPWQPYEIPIPKSALNKGKIMAMAGAWADLDAGALIDYIYKGRHESPPGSPARFE